MKKLANTDSSLGPVLFNKHARISSSPVYLCYLLLKENVSAPSRLRTDRKVPIYSLFNQIRRISPQVPERQVYFAIFLMYALGLIEFDRPYVIIKKHDKD